METMRRKGWQYKVERDKKGRITKLRSIGALHPKYSINLMELADGKSKMPERVLLEKISKRLRKDLPHVSQPGGVVYQFGRVDNPQTPKKLTKTDGERASTEGS